MVAKIFDKLGMNSKDYRIKYSNRMIWNDLFNKIVKNHFEIQPTYRYLNQRWTNSDWSKHYESLKPLYRELENNPFSSDLQLFEQESPNEMYNYTYISLVELNS